LNKIPRRCAARLRSGKICECEALPYSTRCRIHGGAGGRPRGTPEHAHSKAARLAGRARWVERTKAAKARGEIARFPGGRRARGLPPLPRNPKVRKAARIIEKEMAARRKKAVAAAGPAEVPWRELPKGVKLGDATDESLNFIYGLLLREVDPVEDPKLYALKVTVALNTISNQIRLDAAALQAQVALSNIPDALLSERLEAAFSRLDEIILVDEDGDGDAAAGEVPAAAEGG
jgi:hypothetical protein